MLMLAVPFGMLMILGMAIRTQGGFFPFRFATSWLIAALSTSGFLFCLDSLPTLSFRLFQILKRRRGPG